MREKESENKLTSVLDGLRRQVFAGRRSAIKVGSKRAQRPLGTKAVRAGECGMDDKRANFVATRGGAAKLSAGAAVLPTALLVGMTFV